MPSPPAQKERDPDLAFDRQREHKRIRVDTPVSAADLYEQYIFTDRHHDDEVGCEEAIAYWLFLQTSLFQWIPSLAIRPNSSELVRSA